MKIHFLNVGYGEAIVVMKDDFVMVIDGGTDRKDQYLNDECIRIEEYLTKMNVTHVDICVVTHIHDDHIGGIVNVLENFKVGEIWINVKPNESPSQLLSLMYDRVTGNLSGELFWSALNSYQKLCTLATDKNIPIIEKGCEHKNVLLCEDFFITLYGLNLDDRNILRGKYECLFTESSIENAERDYYAIDKAANSTSLAMHIKAGSVSILLTGDKVTGWEEISIREGLPKAQILKLTHHGQIDGMPQILVDKVDPEIFIICSDKEQKFNTPHPSVIARCDAFLNNKNLPSKIFITGKLENNFTHASSHNICAICFGCNEKTGEIIPMPIYK
jgi:competence protein ComEC